MIHFQCPRCGAPMETPDHYAGRTARCPTCNRRIRVPRQARAGAGRDETAPPPIDESSSTSAVFRIEGRAYQVRAKVDGLLIAACITLALSLAVFVAVGMTAPAYSPWFVAGLVAVGFVLFGALLVVPGYYNIRRSRGRKTGERLVFVIVAVAAVLVVAFLCVALVAKLSADTSPCYARLKAVGRALRQYATRNDQLLPPVPETLVEQGYLGASKLTCPEVRGAREGMPTYEPRSYLRDRRRRAVIDLRFSDDESRRFPRDLIVLMGGGTHDIEETGGKVVRGHYVLTLGGDVYHVEAKRKDEELKRQQQIVGRVLAARQIETQQADRAKPPGDGAGETAPPGPADVPEGAGPP